MKELDRITIDPEVCLGQPTIRGMRITVSVILKLVASGMTTREIFLESLGDSGGTDSGGT
jgi:uncharacterized protein (DUF433 family)